jgi:hypothetical protein
MLIDLTVNEERLKRTIAWCRERNIIIPTFSQLKNPHTAPDKIKQQLEHTGLWDVALFEFESNDWRDFLRN